MTTKTEAERRFERFRATVLKNPAFTPLDLEYERALFSALFDPLPPEPKPEPKSLGRVAYETRWGDDGVWPRMSKDVRDEWDRVAAAVVAEYERRNPRKVPTVDEVADALDSASRASTLSSRSDLFRNLARVIFPLFGCEP